MKTDDAENEDGLKLSDHQKVGLILYVVWFTTYGFLNKAAGGSPFLALLPFLFYMRSPRGVIRFISRFSGICAFMSLAIPVALHSAEHTPAFYGKLAFSFTALISVPFLLHRHPVDD